MSAIFFTDSVITSSSSAADGSEQQYRVSEESLAILESLRERDALLGLIVHLREQSQKFIDEALNKSGLMKFFDSTLIIYSDGYTDSALAEAVAKAGTPLGRSLFVGEYCVERERALRAGFAAAVPHPLLVSEVMDGGTLAYVRVSRLDDEPRNDRLKRFLDLPAPPLHFTRERGGTVYVITSTGVAETLSRMGFDVMIFGGEHDPQVTDMYFVRDDRKVPQGINPAEYSAEYLARQDKARFIVEPVDGALLLALTPDVPIEEIHFPNARHGHNQILLADTTLQPALVADVPAESCSRPSISTLLIGDELQILQGEITRASIESFHDPYVGKAPLSVEGQRCQITSRHIASPDNKLVVRGLCEHLKSIGGDLLKVRLHDFILGEGKLSNVEAELPGSEPNSFVIISAHLDSIALDVAEFSPAPGADDDASGIAGVLAAAAVAVRLHAIGQLNLRHSLRFLFFNAEEERLIGSKKYAQKMYEDRVAIVGVFQMDMIGFHGGRPRGFELHAGYSLNRQTEMNSLRLAQSVRDVVPRVSPSLTDIQIYPRGGGVDPADGWSDHSAFHARCYAACMASEDYNTDPGDPDPDPQINRDYHQSSDRKIDYAYAAEIARAVVAAALLTARS